MDLCLTRKISFPKPTFSSFRTILAPRILCQIPYTQNFLPEKYLLVFNELTNRERKYSMFSISLGFFSNPKIYEYTMR